MKQLKYSIALIILLLSCSKASTSAPKDIVYNTISYDNRTIKTFNVNNPNLVDTIKLNVSDTSFKFLTAILMYVPPSTSEYTLGLNLIAKDNKIDFGYYMNGSQVKVKYLNKNEDINPDNISWYSNRGTKIVSNPNFVCTYTNANIPGGGIKLYDILDKEEAYIPFRFKYKINGIEDWRYGWIRCKVSVNSITIYDFGYNKTVNQNIGAGER